MFAIYRKNVAGRVHDRYFVSYDAAKAVIEKEIADLKKWCKEQMDYDLPVEHIDEFNADKGIYLYEYRWKNMHGEQVSHAIVDGYFEDEPDKV